MFINSIKLEGKEKVELRAIKCINSLINPVNFIKLERLHIMISFCFVFIVFILLKTKLKLN